MKEASRRKNITDRETKIKIKLKVAFEFYPETCKGCREWSEAFNSLRGKRKLMIYNSVTHEGILQN